MTIFSKKIVIDNTNYNLAKAKELEPVFSKVSAINDIQPHINFIKSNCFKKIYNNKKICKYFLEVAEHDEQVKQCFLTIYDKINGLGFSLFVDEKKELPSGLYFLNDVASKFSSAILSVAIKATLYGTQCIELHYELENKPYAPKEIKILDFDFLKKDEKGLYFFKNNFSEEEVNKIRVNEKVYAKFVSKDLHLNPNGDGLIYDIAPLVMIRQGLIGTYEKLANNFSYPNQVINVRNPREIRDDGKIKGDYYLNILKNTGSKNYVLDQEDSYNVFSYNINHSVVKDLLDYVDKSISKLILGQNLSSDVQGGSYAAAQVHQETLNQKIESIAKYANTLISHVLNMILAANGVAQNVTFKYNNIVNIKAEDAKTYAVLAKDAGVLFTKAAIKKLGFNDEDIESITPRLNNNDNNYNKFFKNFEKELLITERAIGAAEKELDAMRLGHEELSYEKIIEAQQKEIDELVDASIDEHSNSFSAKLSEAIEKSANEEELLANMLLLVKSMSADDFTSINDALITADIAGYVHENEIESK
jgi:Protein of unknown function (DUF935)